jgi:hypothetical protein
MSSIPYFTSRQRVTYTRPAIHSRSAAHGNRNELFRSLRTLNERMGDLEQRTGTGSISLKTSSPVSTPPQAAATTLSTSPGVFRIQIKNPEFLIRKQSNQPHTPIQHKIEFSSTPHFAKSDVLPIGSQTYYEVSRYGAGQRKYVRISSSFDGHNFNQPKVLGPLTA